jgi:hypothetical protein
MNCHTQVAKGNPKLQPVEESWKSGQPVEWVWLYRTVDYVYYNHSAHVNRGISCFSCHGPVNRMAEVRIAQPHSMAWCLDCHRHAENYLRPDDQVYNLDWKPEDVKPAEFVSKYGQPSDSREDLSKKKQLTQAEIGQTLKERWKITPPTNCQGCHR